MLARDEDDAGQLALAVGDGAAPGTLLAEALDLLDVAAEQERDVQGRRLERNRSRDPVVEKNW